MFAVIQTGGKQYKVKEGQTLNVEKLGVDSGTTDFTDVLLVDDDKVTKIGTPIVQGAKVTATVLGEAKGPKVVIQKYKAKVRYRRKTGHRQHYTSIRIEKISG